MNRLGLDSDEFWSLTPAQLYALADDYADKVWWESYQNLRLEAAIIDGFNTLGYLVCSLVGGNGELKPPKPNKIDPTPPSKRGKRKSISQSEFERMEIETMKELERRAAQFKRERWSQED